MTAFLTVPWGLDLGQKRKKWHNNLKHTHITNHKGMHLYLALKPVW